MLDDRQLFKLGFLSHCADAGLTPLQAADLARTGLEKRAGADPWGWPGKLLGMGTTAAGLGLAAGGVAGAGLGYGAAKLTDDDVDPEEAKVQELIAAYQQQADRARRATAARSYRPARPSFSRN